MPVPTIVATAPVAVAPRPPVTAPEFPGVSEADTPIFDSLWTTGMTRDMREAEAMANEPFESWGLDERAPLPLVALIGELTARVGVGTAWAVEQEVGQEVLNRKALNLGEEDSDEQPDDGPAGDAAVADGPEGPAVVESDAPDGANPEGPG